MAYSSVRVERSSGAVGSPLPSISLVALLTAALGGVLAGQATWAGAHVVAGLAAYAAVSGVIAATVGVKRAASGFGIANQVTLLRAGLVCLIGGALLAGPSLAGVESGRAGRGRAQPGCRGWLARAPLRRGFAFRRALRSRGRLPADPDPGRAGLAVGPGRRLGSGHRPGSATPSSWRAGSCRSCAPRCRRAAGARRSASSRASRCCCACCRRSSHRGERRRGPGAWRIVGVLRRRHHLSCAHQGPLGGERCCCSRPGSAILVIHTGKGVIRRCAAIVPGSSRERPRGDRA